MEAIVTAEPRGTATVRHFMVLFLAAAAVAMSYGATLPLLPVLLRRMQVEAVAAHTGWLTGVYTLGLVVCAPLWGALSDRIDRRWVLGGGLFAAGIALLALETAASLETLYASRVLAGAVSAAVLPTILAYVVDTTVPARRQRRFAWISSASALGFLRGPVSYSSVTGGERGGWGSSGSPSRKWV